MDSLPGFLMDQGNGKEKASVCQHWLWKADWDIQNLWVMPTWTAVVLSCASP